MEASGQARWFERLLSELHFELWIGDAAKIRTKRVRKQKTDRQDAQLILQLLLEDRFPKIWVPSGENRDLRQLLWHRHRMDRPHRRPTMLIHNIRLAGSGLSKPSFTICASQSSRFSSLPVP
jgi:transposase